MISEVGIIGLGLFLWMIYRIFKRADKTNVYNIAMIAAIFGYLCDNFYNVASQYSAVSMIFWLYLALLASDTTKRKEHKCENWMDGLRQFADYSFFN